MSEAPRPEVFKGVCDEAQVRALFADLAAHTEVQQVRLKDRAQAYADPRQLGLDDALAAIVAGSVSGAQITYRWSGQLWIDTLLTDGAPRGGARVVRLPVPDMPAPPAH